MAIRRFVIMLFHTSITLLRTSVADIGSLSVTTHLIASNSPYLSLHIWASLAKPLYAFPRTTDVIQGTFDPSGTVVFLVKRIPLLNSSMQTYLLLYCGRILHEILGYLPKRHLKVKRFLNIYPVILCEVLIIPLDLFGHVGLLSDAGGGVLDILNHPF